MPHSILHSDVTIALLSAASGRFARGTVVEALCLSQRDLEAVENQECEDGKFFETEN